MGAGDVVGEELGQAKAARGEELGRGVLGAVPVLVDIRVGESVVGREVADGDAGLEQARRLGERRRVRHGQEDQVAVLDRGGIVRGELDVRATLERGVDLRERRARVGVGRDDGQLEVGVLHEQPHELGPRVARGADDTDLIRHAIPPRVLGGALRRRSLVSCDGARPPDVSPLDEMEL